jgi:hypothetical protein
MIARIAGPDKGPRKGPPATRSGRGGTYFQEAVALTFRRFPLRWLLIALLAAASLVPAAARADDEGRSFATSALLYLPNRFLDLGDLFRFGVDAGPGLGFDLQATRIAQVKLLSRFSVGVGYQTLRHLPVKASADAAFGVGPIGGSPAGGLGWYRSATDVRLELHLLVLGAHVAVDPVEWVDLPLGLFGLDPAGDDL